MIGLDLSFFMHGIMSNIPARSLTYSEAAASTTIELWCGTAWAVTPPSPPRPDGSHVHPAVNGSCNLYFSPSSSAKSPVIKRCVLMMAGQT
jgi:hypothetical protein